MLRAKLSQKKKIMLKQTYFWCIYAQVSKYEVFHSRTGTCILRAKLSHKKNNAKHVLLVYIYTSFKMRRIPFSYWNLYPPGKIIAKKKNKAKTEVLLVYIYIDMCVAPSTAWDRSSYNRLRTPQANRINRGARPKLM